MNIAKFLRTRIFKNMYERLFPYFRILKNFFFEKWKNSKLGTPKTRKSRKSRKNYSEFSYFRVFDFPLQPKSKTRIWNSWKKISEISEISKVSKFSIWPVKKSATLLNIYYFSSTFRGISLGLNHFVLLFIETGFISTILSIIILYAQ